MVPSNSVGIEIVIIICILLALYFILKQIDNTSESKLWAIPLVMWLLHGLTFYICTNLERYGIVDIPVLFTQWSAILRLHGYLTILTIEFFRYKIHIVRTKK